MPVHPPLKQHHSSPHGLQAPVFQEGPGVLSWADASQLQPPSWAAWGQFAHLATAQAVSCGVYSYILQIA